MKYLHKSISKSPIQIKGIKIRFLQVSSSFLKRAGKIRYFTREEGTHLRGIHIWLRKIGPFRVLEKREYEMTLSYILACLRFLKREDDFVSHLEQIIKGVIGGS